MRQYGVIVVAVVVMVLVASCAPKAQEAKDAGTGDAGKVAAPTTAAPVPAAAPAPAAAPTSAAPTSAAPAPAAGEGVPKVTVLGVGDKRDEKTQKVTHETREFTSATPFVYIFASVTGMAAGQKLKGAIHVVDGKMKSGEEVRDTDLSSVEIASPGPDSHFNLRLGPPTGGWAVGKYELRLYSDGKLFETDALTFK